MIGKGVSTYLVLFNTNSHISFTLPRTDGIDCQREAFISLGYRLFDLPFCDRQIIHSINLPV